MLHSSWVWHTNISKNNRIITGEKMNLAWYQLSARTASPWSAGMMALHCLDPCSSSKSALHWHYAPLITLGSWVSIYVCLHVLGWECVDLPFKGVSISLTPQRLCDNVPSFVGNPAIHRLTMPASYSMICNFFSFLKSRRERSSKTNNTFGCLRK